MARRQATSHTHTSAAEPGRPNLFKGNFPSLRMAPCRSEKPVVKLSSISSVTFFSSHTTSSPHLSHTHTHMYTCPNSDTHREGKEQGVKKGGRGKKKNLTARLELLQRKALGWAN